MAALADDEDIAEADLAVAPLVQLPDDDDGVVFQGDDDDMGDAPSLPAPALPAFPHRARLPAFDLLGTTASSLKQQPDYLLHIRRNRGNLLAAASSCRAIKLYDPSLAFLSSLEGHHDAIITDLCFVPGTDAALLSCAEDGTVCCFDTTSNTRVLKLDGLERKSLYCVTSNGQLIAAGGEAGISFWCGAHHRGGVGWGRVGVGIGT